MPPRLLSILFSTVTTTTTTTTLLSFFSITTEMPLMSLPTEVLYIIADNLHPRDHSAVTLTNRNLASALHPYLISRLRTLPLVDGAYALLAIHWAAASANLPVLKHLIETIPDITLINDTLSLDILSHTHFTSPTTYTTGGPCPSAAWTWISARGSSLCLFRASDRQRSGYWSRRGLTSAEYAITTHHYGLLRLSLRASRTLGYTDYLVRYAATRGRLECLEIALLIFKERFGVTAWEATRKAVLLMISRSRGGVRFFFKSRRRINLLDSDGHTLLHRVVRGLLLGQADADADTSYPEFVHELLLCGADVNAVDADGSTALHVAAGMAHVDVVELLLLGGAMVDVRDADGCAPLHRALRSGRNGMWDVVELLRVYSADFAVADTAGVTARELMEVPRESRSSTRGRNA